MFTVHALLFSTIRHKVINRALILFEKSLTVNNFTGLGYGINKHCIVSNLEPRTSNLE